jgi:anti-sigma factor (TIGR02949 family)
VTRSERITCHELFDFLMSYLDGELPPAEREVFEAHLAACPPCVVYLETYQETVRLGKAACSDPALPDEVPEELVQAILASRPGREPDA